MLVEIRPKQPKQHTNFLLRKSREFYDLVDQMNLKHEQKDMLKKGALKIKVEGLIGQNPNPEDLEKTVAESH